MINASVSDIDAFRRYQEDEDVSLLELLARLRKTEPPTAQMLAGTALHKALELTGDGEFETLSANGLTFALECDIELPLTRIREMSITKDYLVNGETIRIRGRVDELDGTEVVDHKTTGQFDPEHLIAGYQWKLYLDMLAALSFRWNVFVITDVAKSPGLWRVSAFHSLRQYAYPSMRADIDALLTKFVQFSRTHLPERVIMECAA